jgi:hypothetical protein
MSTKPFQTGPNPYQREAAEEQAKRQQFEAEQRQRQQEQFEIEQLQRVRGPARFALLDKNTAERERLSKDITDRQKRQAQIQRDGAEVDRKMSATTDPELLTELARNRLSLINEYERVTTELNRMNKERERLVREATDLQDNYDRLTLKRRRLGQRLGEQLSPEQRAETETELAKVLWGLGVLGDDERLKAEAKRILQKLEDESPWFVVPETYVWNKDRLLRESDPENVGPGRLAYGRGHRITKDEARRVGILEAK